MRRKSCDQRKDRAASQGSSHNSQKKQQTATSVAYKLCESSTLHGIDSPLLLRFQALLEASMARRVHEKQRKITKLVDRRVASEDARKREKYLKPEALSPKPCRRATTRDSCLTTGRNTLVDMDSEPSNMFLASATELADCCIPESSFLANSDFLPLNGFCAVNAPSTPESRVSWIDEITGDSCGSSLLEALPSDLLVCIICRLHHDELKPVFHASRRLRSAVLIARQCHFNFTTPYREHQEKLGLSRLLPEDQWPFSSMVEIKDYLPPPTPRAPRHLPNTLSSRISVSEMRQIAATLFQESTPCRLHARSRGLQRSVCCVTASHRALFYEEDDLCEAVAHNTI